MHACTWGWQQATKQRSVCAGRQLSAEAVRARGPHLVVVVVVVVVPLALLTAEASSLPAKAPLVLAIAT